MARLTLFKNPAFSLYLFSCLIASLANGLSYIGMSWMTVTLSPSFSAIIGLMLSFWTPNIILGPLAGVLAEQYRKKWLLFFSTVLRAACLLFFAATYSFHLHTSFTSLYLLAFFLGTLFALYQPASIAFIREILPQEKLLYANSTIDISYEVGGLIGMGIAGFIIAFTSFSTVFMITGILFLFAGTALILIQKKWICYQISQQGKRLRIIKDFTDSLSYLSANKNLILIYTAQLFLLTQIMLMPALLAPFAKNILHTNAQEFGYIEAMLSTGAIIGSFFIPWAADRFGSIKIAHFLLLLLAAAFFMFSNVSSITTAKLLYFLIGFGFALWPILLTIAQRKTDFKFQARVYSCFNSIAGVIILGTYILLYLGGQIISIRNIYLIQFFFCILALGLLWFGRKNLITHEKVGNRYA